MRIYIAFGVERLFAWTDIQELCRRRGLALYAPLLTCRSIVEDHLGIDPGQGDVEQLAVDMRKLIDIQAQGTFLRLFLWFLRDCESADGWRSEMADDILGMVLLSDIPVSGWVQSLKQATLHEITSVGFGNWEPTPDQLREDMPTLDKFMELLDHHFGTCDPDASDAEELIESVQEPVQELTQEPAQESEYALRLAEPVEGETDGHDPDSP